MSNLDEFTAPKPVPKVAVAFGFLLAFGLLVFGITIILGSPSTAAYIWNEAQIVILAVLGATAKAPIWLLVLAVLASGFLFPFWAPIVDYTNIGVQQGGKRSQMRFYWPGSYEVRGANAVWKEGPRKKKREAFVNFNHVERRGLFGIKIIVPVERKDSGLQITYDGKDIPAYVSVIEGKQNRVLERRLALKQAEELRREKEGK